MYEQFARAVRSQGETELIFRHLVHDLRGMYCVLEAARSSDSWDVATRMVNNSLISFCVDGVNRIDGSVGAMTEFYSRLDPALAQCLEDAIDSLTLISENDRSDEWIQEEMERARHYLDAIK